jgi:carbamoylphosphate synthase large subunit
LETIDLISDKGKTHEFFIQHEIPTARQWILSELAMKGPPELPVYIKPRNIALRGTSEQFYMKVEDKEDFEYALRKLEGREERYVVQQYLVGEEINLDIFCDGTGELKNVVALKRLAMIFHHSIVAGKSGTCWCWPYLGILFSQQVFLHLSHRIARQGVD